ncbi:MAG: hypothetical protein BRD49_03695, partial [Bacteroidetes bacterium SW_10_40_5]
HGNLLGEKVFPLRQKIYGHPSYIYCHGLRKVPWLMIKSGPRKNIESYPQKEIHTIDGDIVSQRLRDLGYI